MDGPGQQDRGVAPVIVTAGRDPQGLGGEALERGRALARGACRMAVSNRPAPEAFIQKRDFSPFVDGKFMGSLRGLACRTDIDRLPAGCDIEDMATETISPPKAFISYAWSSERHEAWVIDLATRLMEDGVQVLFDKWDLKVGHDANAFMEQMVTDGSVTKVLLICDETYAAKADGRMGGVGKEAQILTREIYEQVDQEKYAALITERDGDGKAFTPAYYGGRQYIDFSSPERAETSYEDLLRWIWNKPRYVKPRLGQAPAFITDPEAVATGTTSKFKRAEEAIRAGKPGASGFISDFGDALVAEFSGLTPDREADPFDEEIIRTAEAMRPGLRHLVDLVLAEARFSGAGFDQILRIFEQMGRLMFRPAQVRQWSEDDFDAHKMMCYEGFLCMIAVLVQEQRFDLLGVAVNHAYLIDDPDRTNGPATTTFREFAANVATFERRKQRLRSRQYDLYSDLINETYSASFPTVDKLIEADILLFVRGMIVKDGTDYAMWWPRMIIYARRFASSGLFARSESRSFFEKWAPKVFGPVSIGDFKSKVGELTDQFKGGYYGYPGPNIIALTNCQNLGIRP